MALQIKVNGRNHTKSTKTAALLTSNDYKMNTNAQKIFWHTFFILCVFLGCEAVKCSSTPLYDKLSCTVPHSDMMNWPAALLAEPKADVSANPGEDKIYPASILILRPIYQHSLHQQTIFTFFTSGFQRHTQCISMARILAVLIKVLSNKLNIIDPSWIIHLIL